MYEDYLSLNPVQSDDMSWFHSMRLGLGPTFSVIHQFKGSLLREQDHHLGMLCVVSSE